MSKRKKHILMAIIFLIGIGYVSLLGIYVKKEVNANRKTSSHKIGTPVDNMTVDRIVRFVEENSLDILDDFNTFFTSASLLSDQMKLRYAYYALKDDKVDFKTGVGSTRLESQIKTLLGDKVSVAHGNIPCGIKEHGNIVYYDLINDVYKLNEKHKEHDDLIVSKYDYILNFRNNKGKYELTVNKFFVLKKDVYATNGDAKNKMNKLFSFREDEDLKAIVLRDYEYLKPLLSEYKYTFIKEKGDIILVKYEKLN